MLYSHVVFTGEEFGHDVEFCLSSNLSAFVLENTVDGTLRCVAMGTGERLEKLLIYKNLI